MISNFLLHYHMLLVLVTGDQQHRVVSHVVYACPYYILKSNLNKNALWIISVKEIAKVIHDQGLSLILDMQIIKTR